MSPTTGVLGWRAIGCIVYIVFFIVSYVLRCIVLYCIECIVFCTVLCIVCVVWYLLYRMYPPGPKFS